MATASAGAGVAKKKIVKDCAKVEVKELTTKGNGLWGYGMRLERKTCSCRWRCGVAGFQRWVGACGGWLRLAHLRSSSLRRVGRRVPL